MKIVKLRIDGQEFYLPQDTDVTALQQQVLAAVSGQPAFVTFRPLGHGDMTVLLTQHIPVRFEVEEHSEQEVKGWSEDPPEIDVPDLFPAF